MESRKLQNIAAAVLLVAAVIALVFQDNIWEAWQYYSVLRGDTRPALAEVIAVKNSVQFRLPESLNYLNVRPGLELRPKDTIITGQNSTLRLKFKNGLDIEIQPNSLITLEDAKEGSDTLQVSFLRGEIKVLNEGGKSIKMDTDNISKLTSLSKPSDVGPIKVNTAAIATPTPISILPKVQLEEKSKFELSPLLKEELERRRIKKLRDMRDKETLPDSYITSVIREKRTFIDRCYAQHYRLNPNARGRIDTSLKIEPDGSISAARVEASTIPDPTLQQCVISILQRAKFKAFKGDAIIVKYPINFE